MQTSIVNERNILNSNIQSITLESNAKSEEIQFLKSNHAAKNDDFYS